LFRYRNNWAAQHSKLLEQKSKFSCGHIATTGTDGKTYEMLAMPVERLSKENTTVPIW